VAANVSRQLGVADPVMLTGQALRDMSDGAIMSLANDVDVFAEVEPNQKERIIIALKKAGNVVGFLGTGSTTPRPCGPPTSAYRSRAPSTSPRRRRMSCFSRRISACCSAECGEGRATFANTLKVRLHGDERELRQHVLHGGGVLMLPFLPLLPKQILLMNLMTDFPEMTIATDAVDREFVDRPHRWNLKFIRGFMLTFGLISSIFDYATFGLLMFAFHASAEQFRTGWFLESVVSATLIVLVIRTRKPFFRSRPGRYLAIATILVVAATLALPSLRSRDSSASRR